MRVFLAKIGHNLKLFFIPCDENDFRPKSLESQSFLAYVAAALILKLGIISMLLFLPRTLFYADVTSATLVVLTNETRKSQGFPELVQNPLLAKAAQEKAQDMVEHGYFAHESPDGRLPWYWFRDVGYRYLYAGENLAKDFVDSRAIVDAWLASPLHRANILNNNYQEIGIAVTTAPTQDPERSSVIVVQLFGKRPTSSPVPTPKPSPVKTPSPSKAPIAAIQPTTAPSLPPEAQATPEPTTPQVIVSEVAGSAVNEETLMSSPARHLVLALRLMTQGEKALESTYLAFLAFVILASILNVFIRIDIQHKDLLVRAAILIVFFFLLASFSGQAFLDYVPQVL